MGFPYGMISAQVPIRRRCPFYVCGEETSLLESLEGHRGVVRAKPPLPAHQGLFGKPTVINNVFGEGFRPSQLQAAE